jgi:Ca2+-binding EF-hand superfamily protein
MRFLGSTGFAALAVALATLAVAKAQDHPAPPPAGPPDSAKHLPDGAGPDAGADRGPMRLFVSPMGEPFRSPRDGPSPVDLWFNGADTNHDGALSRAEFRADAQRFFELLDRQHDGEIDPDDIEYYETVLLPEIRVGSFVGGSPGGGGGGGHRGGRGGHRGGGGGGGGGYGGGDVGGGHGGSGHFAGADGDSGQEEEGSEPSKAPAYDSVKQGAARFSFFDYPEPVVAADRDFNRGISPDEFQAAADSRFDALDTNGDGMIKRAELPRFDPPTAGPHRGGSHHGGRRGGGGGGWGGAGRGGSRPGGGSGDGPPDGDRPD